MPVLCMFISNNLQHNQSTNLREFLFIYQIKLRINWNQEFSTSIIRRKKFDQTGNTNSYLKNKTLKLKNLP